MDIHAEAPDTSWSDANVPPLRAFGEDPESPHVCLPVAGLQYYDYDRLDDLLGRLRPGAGDRLQLVRQPQNPHDANAVELRWRNGQFQLGHLPRQIAARISPLIDAGHAIRGYALNPGTGQSWSVWVALVSPCLGDIGHLSLRNVTKTRWCSMNIYRTDKFHHSEEQYRLDAGDFTLLRLTLGRSGGKVKTATAGDARDKPAYGDRDSVIDAFDHALKVVCGRDVPVYVRLDGAGRKFGEVGGKGDRQDFLDFLVQVGLQMARNLGLEELHKAIPAQKRIA